MAANDDIKLQVTIPQAWALNNVCPVCKCESLTVKRFSSSADQLLCNGCYTSFEMSQDGQHARLVTFPSGIPDQFINQWIPTGQSQDNRSTLFDSLHPTVEAPTHEELVQRALKLRGLGNSTEQIRTVLSEIRGVGSEQVEAVMQELHAEASRGRSGWVWAGSVIVGVLVIAIVTVFAVGLSRRQSQASTGRLPAAVQSLITASGGLLKIDPVVVHRQQKTGARTSCPTQPLYAARVFGGEESMWGSRIAGWTMITLKPQRVYVPEGMRAEYPLLDDNPHMEAVHGPAVLENAIYVDIDCSGKN